MLVLNSEYIFLRRHFISSIAKLSGGATISHCCSKQPQIISDLLLAFAPSISSPESEVRTFALPLFKQPSLWEKFVWIFEVFRVSMQTPSLYTNDGFARNVVSIDDYAFTWNNPWLRHGNGRETSEPFENHSLQVCYTGLFVLQSFPQFILDPFVLRKRQQIHYKAQSTTRSVDPRC
jgi:hypothetical protein